jgi:ATP-dependent helicase YprA (DUF1998 family)
MPLKALAHDQLRATRALLALAADCADAAEAVTPHALPEASIARLRRMAALNCVAYDGDTPVDDRPALRRSADIVFSNVDMLHAGLLPSHGAWPIRFWSNLRHVVLDEAHVYTGVFGSHCALVFRRLNRIAASYGASPSYLCSSATIANPERHIALLTGASPSCVTRSGAPSGAKALVLWQPPELPPGPDSGGDDGGAPQRKSVYHEAGEVIADLVAAGLRPLVFVSARKLAEIMASNARSALKERGLHLAATGVESYRGGYAAAERRDLERRLVSGAISAVVSTSALELGIDVGALDATVHVGVPETASAQWQQAGRAGRRGDSVAVIITAERPLDAYFLGAPALLTSRAPEEAHIDPANAALLVLHAAAAAEEMPLVTEDAPLFGGRATFEAAIAEAVNTRTLQFDPAIRAYKCAIQSPAYGVSIRGGVRCGCCVCACCCCLVFCGSRSAFSACHPTQLSRDTFALHDGARMDSHGGGQPCEASLIEACAPPPPRTSCTHVCIHIRIYLTRTAFGAQSIEARNAFYKIHVGAIFRHRLEIYEVTSLDVDARVARGRLIGDAPLATAAKDRVSVRETSVTSRRAAGAATAWLGRVHVTARVTGYVKMDLVRNKKLFDKEFPGPGLLASDMETDGVWWEVPREVADRLASGGTLRQAVAGARNLAAALLPALCACEPADIGAAAVMPGDAPADNGYAADGSAAAGAGAPPDPDTAVRLYVYDCYGGVGLCGQVYEELEELWRRALAVLERCSCATGCASCTQATRAGGRDAGTAKAETRIVLQGLLGAWLQAGSRGSRGSLGSDSKRNSGGSIGAAGAAGAAGAGGAGAAA